MKDYVLGRGLKNAEGKNKFGLINLECKLEIPTFNEVSSREKARKTVQHANRENRYRE